MKKIRHSVFETNSSSTHSLSIAPERGGIKWDTLHPDEAGFIQIYEGEFGWEWETFHDPNSKASYAMTYAKGNVELLGMLTQVISEHCNAPVNLNIDNSGYIDHQSHDVAGDAFVDKDTLKRFIFDSTSYVKTGNDNC